MNFETFFAGIEQTPVNIEIIGDLSPSRKTLDNEALFQLPFICMVILIISKGSRKPMISQVGQLVGECLEKSIPSFKGSSQHLGWSANLRIRTVKALEFLELAKLININNRNSRIQLNPLGKKVIHRALDTEDDLASILQTIAREYRNICVSRKLDMELFE